MLNEKLWNAAAKVYPAVPLSDEARFLPLLELDKGEISSTAAIEIARATRQNAQAIAERLVAELPQPLSGEWRSDLGYIVLRGAQANMLMPEVRSLPEVFPQRGAAASVRDIVALTPDATVPLYARLRLVAAAGLQALLATTFEGSCRLMLSPRPFALIGSRAELVRELGRAGASVQVVMTEAACQFITPVTMQALSGRPVAMSQWDAREPNNMAHINLSREADAILVAPASADFIAKLAQGRADELLSLLCLARPIERSEEHTS